MPQIYDMGPMALFPSEGRLAEDFFRPKNPTASAGFEPANLGTKGQHTTPRPPKPHIFTYYNIIQGHSDTHLHHFPPLLHHVCGRSVEWDTFI